MICKECGSKETQSIYDIDDIDTLLKEMVGEDNAKEKE